MLRVVASLSLASLVLLSGCANGIGSDVQTVVIPAVHGGQGVVHGGQQPVSNSTVTLWAAGTTGYGSASTSLTTTMTASDGSFTLGAYTCPAGDPQVYITSVGGNPGLMSGANTALSLMAALTDCANLKANAATTFININEATTVAAAYALSQFISPSTGSIGSYGYASSGLVNAVLTANNIVNTAAGTALAVTPSGNGVVPQSELNTLADILVPCVNSTGPTSPACVSLFGDLQSTGGVAPTNTLLAALSMAAHPGYNVSTLFLLASGNPAFLPTLSSAPNDWTVAVAYNANASSPRSVAIDGNGAVWIANFATGGASSSLNKLSPTGAVQYVSSTNGSIINGAFSLAIDTNNNVWLGNTGNNTLMGFGNNGNSFTGPFSGLNGPQAMAFDSNGFLWIVNHGNSSIAKFNPVNDSFVSPSGGFTSGISTPSSVALDTNGNAWVGNGTTVTELSPIGAPSAASPISSGGVSSPGGIAVDGSNNVWESNYPTGSVVAELNNSGSPLSGTGYTGGGVGPANSVAIDGGGNVWISEQGNNRIAELTSAGAGVSPSTGYQGGNLNTPKSLAIDGSGNIWLANITSTTTNSITTTISEFIGLAVPVVTPLSAAVQEHQLGTPAGTVIPVVVQSGAVPYYSPGNAYGAQLLASGGNSSLFTWSIASGGLPSPLTLSSSGLISGTTSATGTYTFTVKAADTNNPSNFGTRTLTISANTTVPASGNESALTGSFAMQFEGFKNGVAAGIDVGSDFVASITFNGSGGLTGEIDSNNYKSSSELNTTVTGSYSYGPDNRGTLVLIPTASSTKPIELAFAGGNFSGSTPQTLRFTEFDDTMPGTNGQNLASGAGIGKMQSSSAFNTTTLGQSWVFGMQGETPCANDGGVNPTCAAISPFGPLSAAGRFVANTTNTVTSGEEDVAGINNTYNLISLSGSYTNPDSSGRGTLTLTPTGTLYPVPPSHFIYYVVGSGEMYVMSSDGHATTSLLSGDVVAQTGSFSNSTLSGSYVAYEETGANGDGVGIFPTDIDSSLIYLSVQPGNQFNALIDENNGQGQIKLEQSQGPLSFSVDSNGRMTLSGSQVPVFYLANGGQFFGTEQPSSTNQGGPGLITGLQQTSGSFGCTNTGVYDVGTVQAPIVSNTYSGISNLSTGALTLDQDDGDFGVLVQGLTGTLSCSTDSYTASTGRLQFSAALGASSANIVAYTVVPNKTYVLMSIDPANNVPNVFIVDK